MILMVREDKRRESNTDEIEGACRDKIGKAKVQNELLQLARGKEMAIKDSKNMLEMREAADKDDKH